MLYKHYTAGNRLSTGLEELIWVSSGRNCWTTIDRKHIQNPVWRKSYWIENNPTEMQYGEILTFLLNFDVADYLAALSDLQQARAAADREKTQKRLLR